MTGWLPFALVALVVVPAIAGSLRLIELVRGHHVLPANPRIAASPVPLVVHIVCAVVYAIRGGFQSSPAPRNPSRVGSLETAWNGQAAIRPLV